MNRTELDQQLATAQAAHTATQRATGAKADMLRNRALEAVTAAQNALINHEVATENLRNEVQVATERTGPTGWHARRVNMLTAELTIVRAHHQTALDELTELTAQLALMEA